MIDLLPGFPDAVLAVSARERVTADDYREVLTPALEDRRSRHDRLRLLYLLGPDFRRFTTTALWDDARLGFHHFGDFDRIAVVTDVEWLGRLAHKSAQLLELEIRHFPTAELAAARDWICTDLP